MTTFKLGMATILDMHSPEFLWLENKANSAIPREQLVEIIIHCFGGDEHIASRMLDVVERKMSRYDFLEYCKSSPHFYHS